MATGDHFPQDTGSGNQKSQNASNPLKETAGKKKVRGFLSKLGIPAAIVTALVLAYSAFFSGETPDVITDFIDVIQPAEDADQPKTAEENTDISLVEVLEDFYPTSTTDQVIQHDFYTLSYAEKYEQAEWVAYELDKNNLNARSVARSNRFKTDPKVETGSASPSDYVRSGYDRGHLAPAADMAFSQEAMTQSFFMSNISPQLPSFNRGIWRELEEQTRDWCEANGHLYVATGPVLTRRAIKRFGKDKRVAAPRYYYKVLLDLREPEQKAVAFLLPNAKSNERINEYIVSIDSVEALTGIDFFPALPDELEELLESYSNPLRWIYDEERYQLRVGIWNKEAELSTSYE